MNDIGVNLTEPAKHHVKSVDSRLEEPAVFENVFPRVPFGATKIQDFFTTKIAHAAGPRAESMNEPGDSRQRGGFENAQAAILVFDPASCGGGTPGCFASGPVAGFAAVRGHCDSTSIIGADRSGWHGVGPGGARGGGGLLIVGMGVDIAEVDRIRKAIERHGETFLRRLYTEQERDYCEQFKNKYERYAGRFAAKEAGMKALGTGWRRGVRWVDLEVVREKSGRPTLKLAGEAGEIAKQLGVRHIALSITHTEEQALAQVIFEG